MTCHFLGLERKDEVHTAKELFEPKKRKKEGKEEAWVREHVTPQGLDGPSALPRTPVRVGNRTQGTGGPNLWTSEVISQGLRWVVCENNARQGIGAPARATGS